METRSPAAGIRGLPELSWARRCISPLPNAVFRLESLAEPLRGKGGRRRVLSRRQQSMAGDGDSFRAVGVISQESLQGALLADDGVNDGVGIVADGSLDPQSACVSSRGAIVATTQDVGNLRNASLTADMAVLPPLAVVSGRKPLETVLGDGGTLSLQPLRPLTSKEPVTQPAVAVDEKRFAGSLKGMLFLNLGAALFGSNQVVIKTTERNLSPGALSALRFCIAAVCFAPSIVQGLQKPKLRSAAFELGCWLFGGYTAQALGLVSTTAARGAFTGTFTVLVVPILVGLSGRKISMSTWIAAAVALLGVGCLTTSGADPNVGDLWCILSAIMFGVHKWRSEELTAQFEETTELVSVQIFFLALASLVYCGPELWDTIQNNSWAELLKMGQALPWLSLAYMGLGTTALTLWLEMSSLKEVSSPLAALIYTAEPVWGSLFAYLCLEERWGAAGWVGAALIISSSLFSQLGGDTEKQHNGPEEASSENKMA